MLEYLSANWVWILLIGAMLWMHLGHSGHSGHSGHGGHGGCGGQRHPSPSESHEQASRAHDEQHQP